MFDIGILELALLFVVGLLVLGPERLPRVVRTVGATLRRARQTWFTLKTEITRELDAEDMRRSFDEPRKQLEEFKNATENSLKDSPDGAP